MADSTFSYSIENDKAFQGAIERALKEVNNLKIPFHQIALDFYKSEKAIFKLKSAGLYPPFQGPKVGDTWSKGPKAQPHRRTRNPSLTAYQNYKIKKFGFDYPLLKATGRLEESVTNIDVSEGIYVNTGTGIVLGTQVDYGIYHQSDKERKKVPLRKFLFIGPEAPRFAMNEQKGRLERWLNIINNYVIKKMGQA